MSCIYISIKKMYIEDVSLFIYIILKINIGLSEIHTEMKKISILSSFTSDFLIPFFHIAKEPLVITC